MPTVIGSPGQGTHSYSAAPNNWQSDNAYDIAEPVGTPVLSVISGIVTKVGSLGAAPGSRFAGERVEIHTSDGSQQVWYGHLSKTTVTQGQKISAGDQIGLSGSANGVAHLHFAALNNPGQYIDALTGKATTAGNVITDTAGAIKDKITGAAEDAALGAAKKGVGIVWDAVGEDGTRALLYVLLVFGGVALAVAGVARATGVGQAAKTAAGLGAAAATKGAL